MKSWNDIRRDATRFSKEWEHAYDEKSQAQSFLKEFLTVFGVNANRQATFEYRVKHLDGSQGVVYNNFVWPDPSAALKAKIEVAAQTVLDVRRRWMDADERCSLAILYDSDTMPPDLVEAHAKLDALVDRAYGRAFMDDAGRVAHLFTLYAEAVKLEKR